MGRAHTILQSEFPYNISARSINREWFNLPMQQVWQIFCEELTETSKKHNLQIHNFVLMSNHFHLIATTPDANISQCMHHFMSRSSRKLNYAGNRINETFAGRYHKCILQTQNYYLNAYKYNYRNPVSSGLCKRVEEYPFSTLQTVIGKTPPTVPLSNDFIYNSNPKETLGWLNQAPSPEKLEAARQGFMRPYFKSMKCRKTNKPILDEHDLL